MDITIYSIEVSAVTLKDDGMIRFQLGQNSGDVIRIFLVPEVLADLREALNLRNLATDEPPTEVLDAVAEREASFAESQA